MNYPAVVKKVIPHGYCNNNEIYINGITIEFIDGKKTILTANTDMHELLTVFCDIETKYGKDNLLFDIHHTLRDKMIHSIKMDDTPTFNDTMNGFYTFYNKITILYDVNKTYEFYILQSSNGLTNGYFLIE